MRLSFWACSCAAILGLSAEPASAQLRVFPSSYFWSPGYSPFRYGPYGFSSPFGWGGYPYSYSPGASVVPFYYSSPYSWSTAPTYSYSYGPVISSTSPRMRSSYEGYAGPARTRSSLYPAVSYAEFAAYEQRRAEERDEARATIQVRVPAGAKLAINDRQMSQSGADRTFVTPPLPSSGRTFTYDLKASWTDDLGPRTQQTTVQVRPGRSYNVTFPLPGKE